MFTLDIQFKWHRVSSFGEPDPSGGPELNRTRPSELGLRFYNHTNRTRRCHVCWFVNWIFILFSESLLFLLVLPGSSSQTEAIQTDPSVFMISVTDFGTQISADLVWVWLSIFIIIIIITTMVIIIIVKGILHLMMIVYQLLMACSLGFLKNTVFLSGVNGEQSDQRNVMMWFLLQTCWYSALMVPSWFLLNHTSVFLLVKVLWKEQSNITSQLVINR